MCASSDANGDEGNEGYFSGERGGDQSKRIDKKGLRSGESSSVSYPWPHSPLVVSRCLARRVVCHRGALKLALAVGPSNQIDLPTHRLLILLHQVVWLTTLIYLTRLALVNLFELSSTFPL